MQILLHTVHIVSMLFQAMLGLEGFGLWSLPSRGVESGVPVTTPFRVLVLFCYLFNSSCTCCLPKSCRI